MTFCFLKSHREAIDLADIVMDLETYLPYESTIEQLKSIIRDYDGKGSRYGIRVVSERIYVRNEDT